MTKFQNGNKVRVVDVDEGSKYVLGRIGRAQEPKGSGYGPDEVLVWFDGSLRGRFLEHQLEKVE
jgi:hypothetical protein